MSKRDKSNQWLSHDITQLAVVIIFVALTLWLNNVAYFFGIAYLLLLMWSKRWKWSFLGMVRPDKWKTVWYQATLFSIGLFLVGDILVTPMIEHFTKENIDVGALDGIRGNLVNYLIFIAFMWVVAAFGEEFIYRGFLIHRVGQLFGGGKIALWIAALMAAILFGLAHRYQGISGMITTGLFGLAFGILFIKSRHRLWLTILTHGLYDVIGITLIYLNKDQEVYSLLRNILTTLE